MLPHSRVYDILPAPFAWIDIPAGEVTLLNDWADDEAVYLKKGQPQTFSVSAFAITKYPVTNAHYAVFINAGGYREKKWWTDAGWEARQQGIAWDTKFSSFKPTGKAWIEPRYWQDVKWNGANYPVVGVSWYEALAFGAWLSDSSGECILLPTEQQWQRAAQGDDGRVYPFGNDWDCARCNNSVSPCDSKQTALVTQYEGLDKGDSPFGVTDMVGNVWEWCVTAYETGKTDVNETDIRVLRGGSWYDVNSNLFRVTLHNGGNSHLRGNRWGFRCARSR
jgi:formylglycine-generating enzyme required for sulfatase activity